MSDIASVTLGLAAAATVVVVAALAFWAFRMWLAHRESGATDELVKLRAEVKDRRAATDRAEAASLRALNELGTVGAARALGAHRR